MSADVGDIRGRMSRGCRAYERHPPTSARKCRANVATSADLRRPPRHPRADVADKSRRISPRMPADVSYPSARHPSEDVAPKDMVFEEDPVTLERSRREGGFLYGAKRRSADGDGNLEPGESQLATVALIRNRARPMCLGMAFPNIEWNEWLTMIMY
jgi:hypothetical protein